MPIIERNSPLSSLRSDLQNVIASYSPEMIEKVLHEMGMVPSIDTQEQKNPTFEEASDYYLTCAHFLGLSNSSKKTYISELNQFNKHITSLLGGNAYLRDTADPQFLLEYLNKEQHVNTKSKKSAFLRSYFKVLLKKYFNEHLDGLIKVLKIQWRRDSDVHVESLPKPLTKTQLSEVTALAAASRNGMRNYAVIMTFLTSGIRLNELINLQIGDFNTDRGWLSVIPKGNENDKRLRNINLLGNAILQDYIQFTFKFQQKSMPSEEYKKLYIFSASNGKRPLDPKTIETFVSNIYDQCVSIPKIRNGRKRPFNVHTFRHCFAVYGLEGGLDIFTISKLLGHKDIKSTAIYLDLFNDQLSKAVERHPFAKQIGDE